MITTVKTTDKKNINVDIEHMFDGIANRYDLLNHLLSFGIDKYWRKAATKLIVKRKPKTVIDIATGTAELAIELVKFSQNIKVTGVDISQCMLKNGQSKIDASQLGHAITLQIADAHCLPFKDNSFDAATISFGIRNFSDIHTCLKECWRILKKSGTLHILEFSEPQSVLIKKTYNFYFSKFLPFIGHKISRHNYAYNYLKKSVADFPCGESFEKHLYKAGFSCCSFKPLTFGIVTAYSAVK